MQLDTLFFLKEIGASKTPITFDELIASVIGCDEFTADEIDTTDLEKNTILLLDSIGINEPLLNEFMSQNDDISSKAGLTIAYNIDSQYDDVDLHLALDNFRKNENQFDNIQFDTAMPSHKNGYKRTLVVRGGKKVWINKRNPSKKVHLSPKQKMALAKARLKAHSSKAKYKKHKSMKLRKISFGH